MPPATFEQAFSLRPRPPILSHTDFQVFRGATPATVDYSTPLVDADTALNYVLFDTRVRRDVFTTPAYADQTDCVFGVRADPRFDPDPHNRDRLRDISAWQPWGAVRV